MEKNNNVLLLSAPIKKSYETEAWGQSKLPVVCFDKEIISVHTLPGQMAENESMWHRPWRSLLCDGTLGSGPN